MSVAIGELPTGGHGVPTGGHDGVRSALDGMPAFVRRATNRWTVEPDVVDACVVRTGATPTLAWWMRPLGPLIARRLRTGAVRAGCRSSTSHTRPGRRPGICRSARPAGPGPAATWCCG